MIGLEQKKLPLVALRGLTVFPYMTINFDIGRDRSMAALEEAMAGDQLLFLVTQIDPNKEDPTTEDIYEVGTVVRIKQMLRLPGDTVRVLVEGLHRARYVEVVSMDPYIEVMVEEQDNVEEEETPSHEALMRGLNELFEEYVRLSSRVSPETLLSVSAVTDAAQLTDVVAANALYKQEDKQSVLEIFDPLERLEQLHIILGKEIEILKIEQKINQRVRKQIDKMQKEHYLHEQIKAIQTELGEDEENEVEEFRKKVEDLPLDEDAKKKVLKELRRLKRTPSGSPEVAVLRTWMEWITDLPWNVETKDNLDLKNAEVILDEDHYGLGKVKERIVEYLAVRRMTKTMQGPILCFVGPPGVGKTSIARSIARAIGRNFVRMSLGGVRDEAEIRGHRRTYVGAIPGRLLSNIRQAGSNNPVFLFDEIDKMSRDFRGDPSAALLEVLDAEQNHSFTDHYLELPFDLSRVMFLATANTLDTIPPALLDRMEVIRISGYTEEEKISIARRHLIPKQMKEHGMAVETITISDNTIREMIVRYTREAGVRNLEREIANLCRKVAKELIEKNKQSVRVTISNLEKYLGVRRYKREEATMKNEVGLVTGLAWTAVGGVTLNIEVNTMPGSGKLSLTGQLGDVMKESARAALSYIRANADALGLPKDFYEKQDIHIHIPEGATPKDGPSAGITMATAMISALTKTPVRGDIAMTGEVTLRGRVLPIGGLKEKALAAHRAGIHKVIIPEENSKDITEIPDNVRRKLDIVTVSELNSVLNQALLRD